LALPAQHSAPPERRSELRERRSEPDCSAAARCAQAYSCLRLRGAGPAQFESAEERRAAFLIPAAMACRFPIPGAARFFAAAADSAAAAQVLRLARRAAALRLAESATLSPVCAAVAVGEEAVVSQDAAGEPQPAGAAAELRDAAAVPRQAVAAVVRHAVVVPRQAVAVVVRHAAAVPQLAEGAVQAGAEVLPRAAAAAVVVARRAVVVPWVCPPDQLRRRAPAPLPAARSGRAMERLRIALPSEQWWQAARDEGVS
jgi:hypothetical protein